MIYSVAPPCLPLWEAQGLREQAWNRSAEARFPTPSFRVRSINKDSIRRFRTALAYFDLRYFKRCGSSDKAGMVSPWRSVQSGR